MSSLVGKDIDLTLYPGLLTPALVAWSTNAGGSLVKLITCNDIPGRWVDVCRNSTFFLYSYEVPFWTQEILMSSTLSLHGQCLWLAMHVTPLHIHPMSRCPGCHCTRSVYQAFPCISTESDKRWGEKAWEWGYVRCTHHWELCHFGTTWWKYSRLWNFEKYLFLKMWVFIHI